MVTTDSKIHRVIFHYWLKHSCEKYVGRCVALLCIQHADPIRN